MTVTMHSKEKYRRPATYKRVGAQNHSGTVVPKRRTIDNRRRSGTGRDWYRQPSGPRRG